jgi:hypothetical protein
LRATAIAWQLRLATPTCCAILKHLYVVVEQLRPRAISTIILDVPGCT